MLEANFDFCIAQLPFVKYLKPNEASQIYRFFSNCLVIYLCRSFPQIIKPLKSCLAFWTLFPAVFHIAQVMSYTNATESKPRLLYTPNFNSKRKTPMSIPGKNAYRTSRKPEAQTPFCPVMSCVALNRSPHWSVSSFLLWALGFLLCWKPA